MVELKRWLLGQEEFNKEMATKGVLVDACYEDEADSTKEVWHNGVTIKKYYTTKRNHDICTDKWVEREDVWEMYDAKELRFCDAAIATRVDELLERRKVLESELDTADKDLVAFAATEAKAEDDQQDDQQDEVVQVDE